MAAKNVDLTGVIPGVNGMPDVVMSIEIDPSTGAALPALTPVATPAVAGSQIAKAAAGKLFGLNVASGATAGWVLLIDAAAVPADGAVAPKKAYQLAANSSLDRAWDRGLTFLNGIVVVFSTTGPFAKAVSNTAFISTESA